MTEAIKEVTVTDDSGKKLEFMSLNGYIVPIFFHSIETTKAIYAAIPDIKFREDDVMLCSFAKTGTNWLYEIMSMILNKSAERVKGSKLMTMIEAQSQEMMEGIPSPRVMNTHLNYRFLTEDIRVKQTKTVLILRNPKDTAVSYYNHTIGFKIMDYAEGQWKDWLKLYVNGETAYMKYTDYLKEWEQALASGVGFPLHVMYFEDLKLNGKEEIDKLCKFLEVDLDDKLKLDIMEACNFHKMSAEKKLAPVKNDELFNDGFTFFRKGQIGDWKNWFTVQQNEWFDKVWEDEMKDSKKFEFTYESFN